MMSIIVNKNPHDKKRGIRSSMRRKSNSRRRRNSSSAIRGCELQMSSS